MTEQEQIHAGRINGSCKHSGFAEYDNLTGYVTQSYQREWQDRSGVRWRKTVQIINLGRPDRGIPVDHDALLEPQLFEEQHAMVVAVAALKAKKAVRDAQLLKDMRAFLLEHGPHSARKMAKKLDTSHNRALDVMRANRDVFEFLGGQFKLWGVAGETYSEAPTIRIEVRDYLVKHGPHIMSEVATAIGKPLSTISAVFTNNRTMFCVVRSVQHKKQARMIPVWGVVGIHDKVAA